MAFVAESIVAYEQSATHHLCLKEYVDVYLVEMQKLSVSFGGMTEQGLIYVFVAGLCQATSSSLISCG